MQVSRGSPAEAPLVISPALTLRVRLRCPPHLALNVHRPLVAFLLVLPFLALPTLGQETVFDVPSPDILDKGKVYGELDVTARPVDPVCAFEPRVVVGLGHRIEAGMNFIGPSEPSSGHITLAPTVKWRLWEGKSGWSFFIGDDVFFPCAQARLQRGQLLLC